MNPLSLSPATLAALAATTAKLETACDQECFEPESIVIERVYQARPTSVLDGCPSEVKRLAKLAAAQAKLDAEEARRNAVWFDVATVEGATKFIESAKRAGLTHSVKIDFQAAPDAPVTQHSAIDPALRQRELIALLNLTKAGDVLYGVPQSASGVVITTALESATRRANATLNPATDDQARRAKAQPAPDAVRKSPAGTHVAGAKQRAALEASRRLLTAALTGLLADASGVDSCPGSADLRAAIAEIDSKLA